MTLSRSLVTLFLLLLVLPAYSGGENYQAWLDEAFAAELTDGTTFEYGYGYYVRERDGLRVIGHTGGIHGFSTSAQWLPDERVYVAVLSNLENTNKANKLGNW